ncbi:BBE domain-containing protein [Pseudonocardia sp. GCM10023141]|uniref:BBE domain-containing protein n=1 Tax=Pseudonocardia sp. GCM10023141 TaxID=3252653 RepID=UPI00361FAD1A
MANFGVVTSFTFATVPMPQLTVFQLGFAGAAVTEVLGGWQGFTATAPDELWSTMGISSGNPPTCRVNGCFVGTPAQANPLVDALVAATGAHPATRTVAAKGYLDAMRYFGGCSQYSVAQCHPSWNGSGELGRESFVASSRIMAKPLADPGRVADLLTGPAGVDVLLDSIGGAAGRVAPTDTAFPHRGSLASAQIYAATTPAAAGAATQRVAEVRSALGELVGATGYVNYIDAAMPDWATAYYGGNLERLRQVARTYDPDRVFGFGQGLA